MNSFKMALRAGCFLTAFTTSFAGAEALNLKALIDEALANNPELTALKSRWEAFETRVPRAGALNDPTLRLDAINLPTSTFDFNTTPMSGKSVMFSQQIPFPGTLAARERMARHAAASAREIYRDREGVIVNMVKQAYFSLAFFDRSIRITQKNKALLKDFIRIAQTKYAVGRGLQQDVLKAQVSLSGLMDRLIKLRRMRRTAEAQLNLVLNRPPQAPVGAPDGVTLTPLALSLEAIRQAALENRHLLKGINQTIQQWAAAKEAARRQLWPYFTFTFGYRQRAFMPTDPVKGSDFLSFGVGISLPIYRGRKQHQKVAEAQANIRMVEAQHEAARQRVLFQVQTIYLEIGQHREEAELFRTAILPQAEQSLRSAAAGYQVDKVDFLTLLNNQVTLFNFEIDYYRHVTEHEKQLADLEAVVGKRLF